MHVSWENDFSHSDKNKFSFLQHNLKENFDSMIMNTSKPNPGKTYNAKLISREQREELKEL